MDITLTLLLLIFKPGFKSTFILFQIWFQLEINPLSELLNWNP